MTARHPGQKQGRSVHRQAVYLVPERRVRVVAEGESLAVLEGQVLLARVPLARADRVLCNDRVDWSGKALTTCLRNGVNITWIDARGKALGDGFAWIDQAPELRELMLRYLDNADWQTRLDDWLRRRRLEILLRTVDSRKRRGDPLPPGDVEQLKRSYVYRDESPATYDNFAGWFDSFVAARLGRSGLRAVYWGFGGRELPLARVLARLLCGELGMLTGAIVASGDDDAVRTLFFEAWSADAERRLADLVGCFCGHVAREANTWP